MKTNRRTLLKAMTGIPVLGLMGYGVFEKYNYDKQKKEFLLKELKLDNLRIPEITKSQKGDLLRIGIVGFGSRAMQLANGVGFLHKDGVEKWKEVEKLEDWLTQEDLNVSVTGICEVFDLHAQKGIETFSEGVRSGGAKSDLSVKRYRTYGEILADDDIDAVIIATPDHHHAQMAIDAAKANKHIYLEKSVSLYEDKLNELYSEVNSRDIVFQLGHQITKNVVFQQAKEVIKKNILGKITLIQTTTNRNTEDGAWIRHKDKNGNIKPGDINSIDWEQWLGHTPNVPFSVDRFYNWAKWFDYDFGMLGVLFTHEYDAVNQLLKVGIPKSVVASGGKYFWKDNREIPDVFHATFEYPDKELTLLYSATLSSNRKRGRVFMGHDASMELGGSMEITVDRYSTRYKQLIRDGLVDPSAPMLSLSPGAEKIDAVSSATEKYYASRGLTSTYYNGKLIDTTHLHLKEWIDCIRHGGKPSCDIEMSYEEGITTLMGQKAYMEKRMVEWDSVNRKII